MRGYAYRRTMKEKKDRKLRKILNDCRYTPHAGHIEYGWVDGVWQPVKVEEPEVDELTGNQLSFLLILPPLAIQNLSLNMNNERK